MFEEVYKEIEKYENIVIARHIGVDPDAMASQIGLKEAILETFPKKHVYAIGQGSSKFTYLGKLDHLEEIDYKKSLLIVLDTPDKKRVDAENIDEYDRKIKIDHHPFVEEFCDIEWVNDESSSTCQLIIEFLYNSNLKRTKPIMEKLFQGLISDTNRFMFSNSKASTFYEVGRMMEEYNFDLAKLYEPLYIRPLREVRLQGYIEENLKVTENGVGYIQITDEIINKYKVDASAAGNMINNLNFIEEVYVWMTISEDIKNGIIKVSIRSRGPEINKIAEKYNGGGHKLASGARVKNKEEIEFLIHDLDKACEEYLKEQNEIIK